MLSERATLVELQFDKQPTYHRSGKPNPNFLWFKYGERRVIEHVNFAVTLSWSESGCLLAVARGGKYYICGDDNPRKFRPKMLADFGNEITEENLQFLEMIYPSYKEIREDILLIKEIISSGPQLDNDYETLLSLCHQAKEKHDEQKRSVQTS